MPRNAVFCARVELSQIFVPSIFWEPNFTLIGCHRNSKIWAVFSLNSARARNTAFNDILNIIQIILRKGGGQNAQNSSGKWKTAAGNGTEFLLLLLLLLL